MEFLYKVNAFHVKSELKILFRSIKLYNLYANKNIYPNIIFHFDKNRFSTWCTKIFLSAYKYKRVKKTAVVLPLRELKHRTPSPSLLRVCFYYFWLLLFVRSSSPISNKNKLLDDRVISNISRDVSFPECSSARSLESLHFSPAILLCWSSFVELRDA